MHSNNKLYCYQNITWIHLLINIFSTTTINSVAQLCLTLCNPIDCCMPGFLVHCQFPELAQTHVHRVGDIIPSSHTLSPPSLPVFSLSQHQCLFQWVSSSAVMATVTICRDFGAQENIYHTTIIPNGRFKFCLQLIIAEETIGLHL